MGLAASIAAVIFQAGRKRVMADYAKLMYHNPSGGANDVSKAVQRNTLHNDLRKDRSRQGRSRQDDGSHNLD
jgi:ATP-dependent protease ClpP protease subunit